LTKAILSDCDPEVEKLTRGTGKVVAHNKRRDTVKDTCQPVNPSIRQYRVTGIVRRLDG
jgi:hypothetical protein